MGRGVPYTKEGNCLLLLRARAIYTTLIILHKNTLIEIEPHLFFTKTANSDSIVLKVFLVYTYDVIIVQSMRIQSSTAAIN